MYKAKLQELCHQKLWGLPSYSCLKDGPDHNPRFIASVIVTGLRFGSSEATTSAKAAQNDAARLAFLHFTSPSPSPSPAPPPSSGGLGIAKAGFITGELKNVKTEQSSGAHSNALGVPNDSFWNNVQDRGETFKEKILKLCQQQQWGLPKYSSLKDGPDHNPQFVASVLVNGISFDSSTASTSSKEAQNDAARLAFLHFTSPSPSPSSGGLEIPSAKTITGESKNEKTAQKSDTDSNAVRVPDDLQSQYKTQLQNYARSYNLPLPMYTVHSEGPPHACRFRATVMVDGEDYKSPIFLKNVKEAENAAAKAAMMSLSPHGIPKASSGYYKSLLQELTQKEGLSLPSYRTTKSGASHLEMFRSTVEVEGETFQGFAARSKKQAEINAAMAACLAFENVKLHQSGESKQPVSLEHEAYESKTSLDSANSVNLPKKPDHFDSLVKASESKIPLGSANTVNLPKKPENVHSLVDGFESKISMGSANAGNLPMKKPDSVNSLVSSSTKSQKQDEKVTCLNKESQGSSPTPLCHKLSALSIADPKLQPKTSSCKSYLLCNRVRVYTCKPNMTFPEGITLMPISDDNWVAVSLEFPNEKST